MQTVVAQHDGSGRGRIASPADTLVRLTQRGAGTIDQADLQLITHDRISRAVRMTAAGQRRQLVEYGACPGNNLGAARCIVTTGTGHRRLYRVGAIEGVIQADPARIGSIKCITRVADRHHQLRPGGGRNLDIYMAGVDCERGRLIDQITDATQKRRMRRDIEWLLAMFVPPLVDLRLQRIALGQQRLIARRKGEQDGFDAGPELSGAQASARQGLLGHKFSQDSVDL